MRARGREFENSQHGIDLFASISCVTYVVAIVAGVEFAEESNLIVAEYTSFFTISASLSFDLFESLCEFSAYFFFRFKRKNSSN